MTGNMITLSVEEMRQILPYFEDMEKYSSAALSVSLEQAQNHVSRLNLGVLKDGTRAYVIYLMAAHLQVLRDKLNKGEMTTGLPTSASVGQASITLTPPKSKDQFDYWLNLTHFGQELLFELNSLTGVGFYFGGSGEDVFR